VDGGQVFAPALNRYPNATQTIGTPSVDVGLREDVYLTFIEAPKQAGGSVVIGVLVEPLVSWLWLGGLIMAVGTLLALVPGGRRLPTAPVSEQPSVRDPDVELVAT
jgi:cytochrome c-type biogenesis protein CcmF